MPYVSLFLILVAWQPSSFLHAGSLSEMQGVMGTISIYRVSGKLCRAESGEHAWIHLHSSNLIKKVKAYVSQGVPPLATIPHFFTWGAIY